MAEVYVGSTMGAEGFSRRIAIKRVLPGYSDNAGFAQMFIAEAQISSQLVHPNIVSVLDFDRDADGRLFLVMELIDGKDLDALIATGLLPLPVVIFVIGEVLRGLGFAHDLPMGTGMRGIVHRDISPHNVLLSWEGAVKVSDFGIAKARAASEATASVFIKGKPAYMSPEQANGQRLDGRSDLFAVGVMLWEMLVGQRLFIADDTRATLAAVLFGQIPRPRTARADLPKDLERVTMKLLERDLPARYATAEDAIADLMNCGDAPRSGREVLIAVLAERFPGTAPVRQSIARRAGGRGAVPTPQPATIDAHSRPTLTGNAAGPLATSAPTGPGLSTVMSAPTSTIGPQRQRLPQVLIVLGVLIASGVATFMIVSAARHRAGESSPALDMVRDAGPRDASAPESGR
jgi:serine/threonine-protein kinase